MTHFDTRELADETDESRRIHFKTIDWTAVVELQSHCLKHSYYLDRKTTNWMEGHDRKVKGKC